jgi:hypothetical protein
VVGFGISSVEHSDPATTMLVVSHANQIFLVANSCLGTLDRRMLPSNGVY